MSLCFLVPCSQKTFSHFFIDCPDFRPAYCRKSQLSLLSSEYQPRSCNIRFLGLIFLLPSKLHRIHYISAIKSLTISSWKLPISVPQLQSSINTFLKKTAFLTFPSNFTRAFRFNAPSPRCHVVDVLVYQTILTGARVFPTVCILLYCWSSYRFQRFRPRDGKPDRINQNFALALGGVEYLL